MRERKSVYWHKHSTVQWVDLTPYKQKKKPNTNVVYHQHGSFECDKPIWELEVVSCVPFVIPPHTTEFLHSFCYVLVLAHSESTWVGKCAYHCVKACHGVCVCACTLVLIGKARCRLAGCFRVKDLSSRRQKQWINYCGLSLGRVSLPSSLPPSFSRYRSVLCLSMN